MTYWKKCGKKGKKITTLVLSLAMLGTSTAPSVHLLGRDIASVYADEDVNTSPVTSATGTGSSEDQNIGIPSNEISGLTISGNVVKVMFRDYNNRAKMDRYYANAGSVEINGVDFSIDEFNFTTEPSYSYGDWTSKKANFEKHKVALNKYDDKGRKYKLVIKLKDGKTGVYVSPEYKAAQEAGEIPADEKPSKPSHDEKLPETSENIPSTSTQDTDTTGYTKKRTRYTKNAKDRSLDTSVYGIKALEGEDKGVVIDMFAVSMDTDQYDYKLKVFSRIKSISVDGKTIENKGDIKQIDEEVDKYNSWNLNFDPRFGLVKVKSHEAENRVLRNFTIKDKDLYEAFKKVEDKKENHRFAIKFVDGSTIKYETGDKKPEGITLADFYKDAIKNVTRKSQSIVINLKGYEEKTDDELQEHRDLVYGLAPHIKQVIINGYTVQDDKFIKNSGGNDFMNIPNGDQDPIIKNWNSDLGANNKVVFYLDDNSTISWSDNVKEEVDTELPQEEAKELEGLKKIDIKDLEKAPDGKYTIGFEAKYADGRKGTSMLQGFFDRNVEVEKRGDKLRARFLNLFFADGLLDFRIKNTDNTWPEESKKDFVDPVTKTQAYFTMDLKDLTKAREGAVLVSYMGGKLEYKGMMDTKYTKVKIVFKKDAYEGWKGFHETYDLEQKRKLSPEILKKRLTFSGLDRDNDGQISSEELEKAPTVVDLTWRGAPLERQFNTIYDISSLKDLGPNVKVIKLSSNSLKSLPAGVFDKAVNLEEIYLNGNKISEIPKDIFKNNRKLRKVSLASNPIAILDKDLFANNPEITDIDLGNTMISEVKEGSFDNLTKLKNLDLSANDLSILSDGLFKNNKELKSLSISDNALLKLPSSLSGARKLERLGLGNNRLTKLPDYVGEFASLKHLDLKFNDLSDISRDIWNQLAKREGLNIDLTHNNLTSLPSLSDVKFASLNVAGNLLPAEMPAAYESLKINKSQQGGYYAQRSPVDYNLSAKNGKVEFSDKGDINILDLLNWNEAVTFENKKIFKKDEYKDYSDKLLKKNGGKHDDIAGKIRQARDFKIVTRVERVYDDGSTKTIYEKEDLNKLADPKETASDKRMENGSLYRLTQQLYTLVVGEWVKNYEVSKEARATVDANSKTETGSSESTSDKKLMKYTLPVNLVKYDNRSENSMGADAMDKTVEVEETSQGIKLTLNFHSMEYVLAGKKRIGHLYRMGVYDTVDEATGNDYVPAKVLSKYEDAGSEFPGKVSFTRTKRGEKEIAVRVWVDAMDAIAKETGNANQDASQPAILSIDWSKAPKESIIGKDTDKKTDSEDKNNDTAASKALLKNSIKMAEKMLKTGLVEGRSKEILEKALENAKAIYNAEKKGSYESANDIIMFAMDNIKKESGNKESTDKPKDIANIKDLDKDIAEKENKNGAKLYSVPVILWHASDSKESMGNGAIVKTAIVSEKEGKYTYYIDFNGMPFFGMYGHLWDLNIYENGLGSAKVPAKVEKTKMDKDLTGQMREFPARFSFTRNTKEKEIFAEVAVDAMDSMKNNAESYDKIVKGSGKQNAKFIFDWSAAKQYKEGDQDSTNTSGGRLAGADRYETSAKISQKYFDKAETVVLASGKNTVDALVSASYADAKKSPILLSKVSDVPASIKAEILRLGAKNVVIVGGNASISAQAETELKTMGLSTRRIAGSSRYETSAILAQEVKNLTGSDKLILITGQDKKEADALTVSSIATKAGIPVMMTKANGLDSYAREKINSWKPSQVIVVGGKSTISDGVMEQVNAKSKIRIAGATRFETATMIANEAYPSGKHLFVTNGYKAVDALAAGAVTRRAKSPILLVGSNSSTNEIKKLASGKTITTLGGTSTVSDKVIEELK
nr:cell wall-binding repeat-containing protein [uncultured Peptostreptococcus sp.]